MMLTEKELKVLAMPVSASGFPQTESTFLKYLNLIFI